MRRSPFVYSVRYAVNAATLLLSLCLLGAGVAHAQTVKTGGDVIDETWTVAGSPYVVQGDLTVPAGAYLIIEAGVTVQFAAGDLEAGGTDNTRTELIVNGTLSVNGTGRVNAVPDVAGVSLGVFETALLEELLALVVVGEEEPLVERSPGNRLRHA